MKKKLAEYVADFLASKKVDKVFVLSGGASLHLIHACAKHPEIDHICPAHEQACAMAADGYARVTGRPGVAITTSGPGATNLLTGVCSAYYDSVPCLFLTGQVATFRFRGLTNVRQYGFQETATTDIFRSVTKYVALLEDPLMIRFELEKAWHIATSGRMGPVLIDIPDDLQRTMIDVTNLKSYVPEGQLEPEITGDQIKSCIEALKKSKRPILIAGWGIRIAGAVSELLEFAERFNIPVAPTWAMYDSLPNQHPLKTGTFGTHGTRDGNFAVQNSDLLISIGSRLDTHETGSPLSSFAREAYKIAVDIDSNELNKFAKYGMKVDLPIHGDAKGFLTKLISETKKETFKFGPWVQTTQQWKDSYPVIQENHLKSEKINPYAFVNQLSQFCKEDEVIFIDTGCSIAWMMQAFQVKPGQRLLHDFNNTAMGWALPASIGACVALGKKRIVCVTGDGSLMMNLQELATANHLNLPITVILLNNHGHTMIQQTQDQWLDSEYFASSPEGGLGYPNFVETAKSFGFKTWSMEHTKEMEPTLAAVMAESGPCFLNVEISSQFKVATQVKYGRPIEDSEPLLPRDQFLSAMIVKPMEVSLKL